MKKKNKNIVRYTVNKEFKRNSKDPPPQKKMIIINYMEIIKIYANLNRNNGVKTLLIVFLHIHISLSTSLR